MSLANDLVTKINYLQWKWYAWYVVIVYHYIKINCYSKIGSNIIKFKSSQANTFDPRMVDFNI